MAKVINKPGVYEGIPFAEYRRIPAVNNTALGWMERSPAYAKWRRDNPAEDTPSTSLGTAAHCATTQPEAFADEFVVEPDYREWGKTRGTNGYREAIAALEAEGKTILTTGAMDSAKAIAAAVHGHTLAAKLLKKAMGVETTLVWEDQGHRCKARLDLWGDGWICDLKTTREHTRFSPHVVTKYGIYRQAAWYRRGAAALELDATDNYFLIVVANTPPYEVTVYLMDDLAIAVGDEEAARLFVDWRACVAADEWPGDCPDLQTAEVADWKLREVLPEEVA